MSSERKNTSLEPQGSYRGRIAPTPTGWLHLGHASTFQTAWERARQAGGTLIYRTEDLDPDRCQPDYSNGAMEDLLWWGLDWDEGPDKGGSCSPYVQSARMRGYEEVMRHLHDEGWIYPSPHSRKQIAESQPKHSPVDDDLIFPKDFRQESGENNADEVDFRINWRFRVPDDRVIDFIDGRTGRKAYTAGQDFGDFLVWRKDGVPAYELAVVIDDHQMGITEVVRGEDLLLSTARQILLYEALGWSPPLWFHCPLINDPATGKRMSKTHKSLGLRALHEKGHPPGLPVSEYFALK